MFDRKDETWPLYLKIISDDHLVEWILSQFIHTLLARRRVGQRTWILHTHVVSKVVAAPPLLANHGMLSLGAVA